MPRNFSFPGRSAVHACNGMIATSHPLASAVGLKVLTEGGSAVDAAIAATAMLSMAEPQMTGIGGDCFALISPDGSTNITAINGSGRAPQAATADAVRASLPGDEIPRHSAHAVTVPGAVGAWWAMHQRFGRLDWDRLLWPATAYAEDGIAVHARVARDWALHVDNVTDDADAAAQYLDQGKAFAEGALFRQPRLAAALQAIQQNGADGFYKGPVMEDMVSKLQSIGGLHSEADFTTAEPEFVTPIAANYHGHTIWECPPNGQGVAALMLLRIMERFDLNAMDDIDRIHVHAEASKIAYQQRDMLLADPLYADVPVASMLADETFDHLAAMIDMKKAATFAPSDFPDHKHTIYLAVVDQNGMAVSMINSIFDDFGSGISTPEFGVLFHSRGKAFRLDDNHPNVIAGGKRPLHTIIPGMISRGDELIGPFGVMGGQYQAAGHGMVISRMLSLGLNPQEALDLPRSFAHQGVLQLEEGYSRDIADALAARGHVLDYPSIPIGGGQAILRNPETGVLTAGSDPRKDGSAIGY
ncbi:MAG: gamma-glutamyltransferase family protein [Candidatus Puniceispirillales bacterium]